MNKRRCIITRAKNKFYLLLFSFQIVLLLSLVFSINTVSVLAQGDTTTATFDTSLVALGLAIGSSLAVGLSVLGAGIAIKTTGTAAISMLAEQPEGFFKAFLVVALGEALAVYGLIVAILLWTKIPTFTL
ncbi:MAG: V-type ATP synthase subunit K [Promethearchaeia archaeon]|nr:MAG: V-type ATP synthase subunit K [Candidatus Lokiarchaeia archaeon]